MCFINLLLYTGERVRVYNVGMRKASDIVCVCVRMVYDDEPHRKHNTNKRT